MRFHSRHPPASLLGKRAQTRILRMMGLLVLVIICIKVAGRASFWSWMFPDEQNGNVSQPSESPEIVDPKKFKVRTDDDGGLKPGEFIAVAPADPTDSVAKVDPESAETVEFEPGLFAPVRDNYLSIRRDEQAAYYAVLARARDLPPEILEKAADPDISYAVLMNQSMQFRGKPITVRGEVRQLSAFKAGKNEQGIEDLWDAWFYTADRPYTPYRIVCTEIPPGIPRGDELTKAIPVRVTGFFFKIQGYHARSGLHTAPLLLARTIHWLPPPPKKEAADSTIGLWIVGLVCLTAVGLAVTFWRISASDRASQTRSFHRYYEPRPEALESLKSLEANGEADMFRHLAEGNGQTATEDAKEAESDVHAEGERG